MKKYRYSIGGLSFSIESHFPINNLETSRFVSFETNSDSVYHDICFFFSPIELEDLPENDDSYYLFLDKLESFIKLDKITPSTLTIPPAIIQNAKKKIQEKHAYRKYDFPLLQSPKVQARIDECIKKSQQIQIILHQLTIEIHDFFGQRSDIFYNSCQQYVLNDEIIENGIRRLFSLYLPSFSSLMLHSSGINFSQHSALFLAPDEGGKTTIQQLCPKEILLSDDRNIIRKTEDTFLVFGTPWGSVLNANNSANLGALFWLEKSKEFSLTPLKPSEMFQYIWNEHFSLWKYLPKSEKTKIFHTLNDICHNKKSFKLSFPSNYVDWDAIEKVLA